MHEFWVCLYILSCASTYSCPICLLSCHCAPNFNLLLTVQAIFKKKSEAPVLKSDAHGRKFQNPTSISPRVNSNLSFHSYGGPPSSPELSCKSECAQIAPKQTPHNVAFEPCTYTRISSSQGEVLPAGGIEPLLPQKTSNSFRIPAGRHTMVHTGSSVNLNTFMYGRLIPRMQYP